MINKPINSSLFRPVKNSILFSVFHGSVGNTPVIAYVLNYNGQEGATPNSPITISNTDIVSFNMSGFTFGGTNESFYIAGSDFSEYIYVRSDGRFRFIDSAGAVRQISGLTQLFDGGDHYVEMHLSPNDFELFIDGASAGSLSGAIADSSTFNTLFRRSTSVNPVESEGAVYNITFGSTASYPLQSETPQGMLSDVISSNDLTLIDPDLSPGNFIEVELVGDQ